MIALAWLFATACGTSGAPAAPTAAPASSGPPAPAPSSAYLTAFWAIPDGGCGWRRVDLPGGRMTALVDFAETCPISVQIAVSRSGDSALVRFDDALYRVTLEAGLPVGTPAPLPVPAVGAIEAIGFNAASAPVVLTIGGATRDGGDLVYDGQRFPTTAVVDGTPDLAHAWTWTAGAWQHTEMKLCSTGWDEMTGTGALDAARRLRGARSSRFWGRWAGAGTISPSANDVGAALAALAPPDDAVGEWAIATVGAHRLAVWNTGGDFSVPTGPVAVEVAGTWNGVDLPKRASGIGIAVQERDGNILVVDAWGNEPLVFRIADGSSVWSGPGAVGATFWPPPGMERP